MSWRLPGWETIAALIAGVSAAALLPSNFYGQGTAEIITILGFLMAALVPAMALGATAIRSGQFSVKRIRALSAGIDSQIKVFGGLFLYALLACLIAVVGKLVDWTLPAVPTGLDAVPAVNPSGLFVGGLTFLLALLLTRSIAFVSGMRSILRLSSALAEDEARARDKVTDQQAADELASYTMPTGYGSRVDLPH